MDFYALQEFLTNTYPEKNIEYVFDKAGLFRIAFVSNNGSPFIFQNAEYNKVLVKMDGSPDRYYDLRPYHMNTLTLAETMKIISEMEGAYIEPMQREQLKQMIDQENALRTQANETEDENEQQALLIQADQVKDQIDIAFQDLNRITGLDIENLRNIVLNPT